MKKTDYLTIAFGTALLVVGTAIVSYSQPSARQAVRDDVNALQAQNSTLNNELSNLTMNGSQLAAQYNQLTANAKLLAQAQAGNQAGYAALAQDANAYKARVIDHNGRPCTYPPGSQACAAYDAEAAQGARDLSALKSRAQDLDNTAASLQRQQQQLSQATLNWAASQKKFNADAADHQQRTTDHVNEVKALVRDSRILRDLAVKRAIVVKCNGIDDLAEASQCLQEIWDAAKPYKSVQSSTGLRPKGTRVGRP